MPVLLSVFFFTDTAPTNIYTLSLHDALPIFDPAAVADHRARVHDHVRAEVHVLADLDVLEDVHFGEEDRKSTRLNSSHRCISYAVFCLKKKKQTPLIY